MTLNTRGLINQKEVVLISMLAGIIRAVKLIDVMVLRMNKAMWLILACSPIISSDHMGRWIGA